jgi:hypothetical protein
LRGKRTGPTPSDGVRAWDAHGRMEAPRFGLCDQCVHQQLVKSGRGSVFSMCRIGLKDPDWPKYPQMPVVRCSRFEQVVGQPQG